jgi:lysophospholipase L1-like esterase/uncharacterized cupredoxin-like copper-binding protein
MILRSALLLFASASFIQFSAAAVPKDVRLTFTDNPRPAEDPALAGYGMYEASAPRPELGKPMATALPLELNRGDRIAFIGNTLLDRSRGFGYLESLIQRAFPKHRLVVRNLSWSGDSIRVQPRPLNLADLEQHLTFEKVDVIFAAYGFNESFAGTAGLTDFRRNLNAYLKKLRSSTFNGGKGPRIILLSPIANEDTAKVAAATMNNEQLASYTKAMQEVAEQQNIGFVDVFQVTREAMASPGSDLTFNGIHMDAEGYRLFADEVFQRTFGKRAPKVDEALRKEIVEKDSQYFHRYRPLNTYYYTGARSKEHGYNDFLPAMRNFDLMVSNRYDRIWSLAQDKAPPAVMTAVDLPRLGPIWEGRGTNAWLSAEQERKAFLMDPRFEVNLFAGEEEFPEIACPIQIRWDSRGRLWVSCSTTYPQLFPGQKPDDKLVILEDTDGDGRADKSSVFADDLYTPLAFEFGNGGVYVSEQPHLLFLKDTNGDGKADYRKKVLTGFGCEDSHHALHDFAWTPDGDLIFRESIFHHSQVETAYGPVRQQNSGWFRYDPKNEKLTTFGCYPSTNPWGVTFDEWGQHVASHPIFASAFHALDPVYPQQHPKPAGLPAYSGTCGHDFIDFETFPKSMRGGFAKARYKPTNRIEYHEWNETPYGYEEKYVSDILFSSDLSFIPVDLRFGPRGSLYICDWYNPIKSHNQYSLRDPRRDRKSGRIWRITPKGGTPADPPKIAGATIGALLEILKSPHYRYRYWTRRELRERNPDRVKKALDQWVAGLEKTDPRFRHHQTEAMWVYRGVGHSDPDLIGELVVCEDHHARAAATRQLRYTGVEAGLLKRAANDTNGLVRLEAAVAASYRGSKAALDAALDTLKKPHQKHLTYAIRTALGSRTLQPIWENNLETRPELAAFLAEFDRRQRLKPRRIISAQDAQFDTQKDLKRIKITCIKERMLYSLNRFEVKAGQAVRLEFVNPDATAHNLVIVEPGAMLEVGMAAIEMAKDPVAAKKGFIPNSKKILHHTRMLAPEDAQILRFKAPTKPGVYPYLCTFPGHWVLMKGEMIVK